MTDNQRIVKLAAETGMVPRTVRRWWEHENVSAAVAYACELAARKLGFERPAKPEPAS